MNKSEYLYQLRKELSGLSLEEIEDIVRDQEEYFHEAASSGRDEASVIKSLGAPSDFAKELKAQYQINAATTENKILPKTKNIFKAIVALCVLAPFNFIFVLGPFLFCCGMLMAGWTSAITFIGVSLAGVAAGVYAAFLLAPLFGTILTFGSLTALGISVLCLFGAYFITGWFLKMTISFLKWNVEFVTVSIKE